MKFEEMINTVITGDCLEVMKDIPDNSIDLVVTSPPYDNLRAYKGYVFDFSNIAKELYRVTKQGGVLVWVVGDATVDGSETGTSFRQALYFKQMGFNLHDTMIFKKANPIPLTHNRYEQAFEYMFVFSKDRPKTFNPICDRTLTSGRYTHRRNTGRVKEASTRNRGETTVTKETKYKINIWEYVLGSVAGETGHHPAPFSEKLAEDHIVSWSNPNDIVMDIFSGSGTTCKMARKNERRYIGIDVSEEYNQIAKERLRILDMSPRML